MWHDWLMYPSDTESSVRQGNMHYSALAILPRPWGIFFMMDSYCSQRERLRCFTNLRKLQPTHAQKDFSTVLSLILCLAPKLSNPCFPVGVPGFWLPELLAPCPFPRFCHKTSGKVFVIGKLHSTLDPVVTAFCINLLFVPPVSICHSVTSGRECDEVII